MGGDGGAGSVLSYGIVLPVSRPVRYSFPACYMIILQIVGQRFFFRRSLVIVFIICPRGRSHFCIILLQLRFFDLADGSE